MVVHHCRWWTRPRPERDCCSGSTGRSNPAEPLQRYVGPSLYLLAQQRCVSTAGRRYDREHEPEDCPRSAHLVVRHGAFARLSIPGKTAARVSCRSVQRDQQLPAGRYARVARSVDKLLNAELPILRPNPSVFVSTDHAICAEVLFLAFDDRCSKRFKMAMKPGRNDSNSRRRSYRNEAAPAALIKVRHWKLKVGKLEWPVITSGCRVVRQPVREDVCDYFCVSRLLQHSWSWLVRRRSPHRPIFETCLTTCTWRLRIQSRLWNGTGRIWVVSQRRKDPTG